MVNKRGPKQEPCGIIPTPEDAEDTEFLLQYTNTNILHITKNKVSEMLSGANI